MERGQERKGRGGGGGGEKDWWLTVKEVKNEENSLMYLTGFDLENSAQFCSLFKEISSPRCAKCVKDRARYLLGSALWPGFLWGAYSRFLLSNKRALQRRLCDSQTNRILVEVLRTILFLSLKIFIFFLPANKSACRHPFTEIWNSCRCSWKYRRVKMLLLHKINKVFISSCADICPLPT